MEPNSRECWCFSCLWAPHKCTTIFFRTPFRLQVFNMMVLLPFSEALAMKWGLFLVCTLGNDERTHFSYQKAKISYRLLQKINWVFASLSMAIFVLLPLYELSLILANVNIPLAFELASFYCNAPRSVWTVAQTPSIFADIKNSKPRSLHLGTSARPAMSSEFFSSNILKLVGWRF